MSTLVVAIHVIVCLFLMMTVLLQSGKGGMGSAFGAGNTQSVFGGSGANPFLQKLTTWAAIIFMLTSMTLAYLASTATHGLADIGLQEEKKLQAAKDARAKALEAATPAPVTAPVQPGVDGAAPVAPSDGTAVPAVAPGTEAAPGASTAPTAAPAAAPAAAPTTAPSVPAPAAATAPATPPAPAPAAAPSASAPGTAAPAAPAPAAPTAP